MEMALNLTNTVLTFEAILYITHIEKNKLLNYIKLIELFNVDYPLRIIRVTNGFPGRYWDCRLF